MKDDNAEFYRRSVEDLIVAQNSEPIFLEIVGSEGVCPLDKKPCGFVSSCDDVLSLALGLDFREGASCPRAVAFFKAGK